MSARLPVWMSAPPHEFLQPHYQTSRSPITTTSRNCIVVVFFLPSCVNRIYMSCQFTISTTPPLCSCQSRQQPILRLRGFCKDSALKPTGSSPVFTPRQLAGSPKDIFLVGGVATQIRRNDSSEQWVMTNAVATVRAESRATKVSYVLGKHKWRVTGDVYSCNEGQPYTTLLKMSGCNPEGEFTCDDGQCVTMEERCNQIPNCRDGSDELECKLLILDRKELQ